MLLNNIPVAIGTVLMALGWDVNTFIIGRIILGFACGEFLASRDFSYHDELMNIGFSIMYLTVTKSGYILIA